MMSRFVIPVVVMAAAGILGAFGLDMAHDMATTGPQAFAALMFVVIAVVMAVACVYHIFTGKLLP